MTHFAPLAERLRPAQWDHFVGQEKLLHENGIIRRSIERSSPANLLLFGPPGSGKTSLAWLYIKSFSIPFHDLHPSHFQTSEVKRLLEETKNSPLFRPTIFWIDEIHRLTRPQQDLLLKGIEEGAIVLLAATTENPSFVLSNALLSRLHVLTFSSLKEESLKTLLERALHGLKSASMDDEAKTSLISWAKGDARKLLSALEPLVGCKETLNYNGNNIQDLLSGHDGHITANAEGRYLLISALHKAVRGSSCQASLYWLARLLQAGEDPLYIARRVIRMAIEDIGLADPNALTVALNAQECFKSLGSPEGELSLAEAILYLALAPKSASSYLAFDEARKEASLTGHIAPPKHILNAPTRWMKEQGFSEGYKWDHDEEDAFSGQEYFPDGVEKKSFYTPVERGFERELQKRIAYFEKLKEKRRRSNGG